MAKLPAFSLPGSDSSRHSAASLKGTMAVIYFYPKDATTGCTQEACDFRDQHKALAKLGVQVFGVSPDPLTSHAKFIAKQKLPFVLLADEDHAFAQALGVWAEKSMYGRKFMGVVRSTFFIGKDGSILAEWRKVKVAGHVDEVVAAVKIAVKA